MLVPCYFSELVVPVGLVVTQVAWHFWFLRTGSADLSRDRRLTYRKDYTVNIYALDIEHLLLLPP